VDHPPADRLAKGAFVILTTIERALYILLSAISFTLAAQAVRRIDVNIGRGQGRPDWRAALPQLPQALLRKPDRWRLKPAPWWTNSWD